MITYDNEKKVFQNYLYIQRGTFKNVKSESITGLDSLVAFDYMGSSEFEWGALPKSLRRILYENDNKIGNFNCKDLSHLFKNWKMEFLYNPESIDNPDNFIKLFGALARDNVRLKESSYIGRVFAIKPDSDWVPKINFWWDIEYDWFLYPEEKSEYIIKALECLRSQKKLINLG